MSKSWFIKGIRKLVTKLLTFVIRFYQVFISPLHPGCCRFYPTCSQYSLEAIKKHGPVRGSYLAARRILRCNPYHKGGYDPVPEWQHIKRK